jgi:hypothetical protein
MLKRSRPISPPLRPSIPFELDLNVAPAYTEFISSAREVKRPRIFANHTPDSTVVMGVHGWPGHSHGYHTSSDISSKRRRLSPEAMEEDGQDAIANNDSPRDIKRRRTVAPSLDGKSRGWEPPSPPTTHSSSGSSRHTIEGGDEDYDSDWDTEDDTHGSSSEGWEANLSEYRDANTLLHTLHAQSRIRVQPTFHSYHAHPQQPSSPSVASNEFVSQGRTNAVTVDSSDAETQMVKERYEERNKLASLPCALLHALIVL